MSNRFTFHVGSEYKRRGAQGVKDILGLDPNSKGGAWDTGLVRHDDAYFIFCNVGVAGRTGHDYGNYFDGDDLDWSGATTSHKDQPSIKAITTDGAEVHVFYRTDDHHPFTYAGLARAVDVSDGRPVRVVWRFGQAISRSEAAQKKHMEGAKKTVTVTLTTTERSPEARRRCIDHHGAVCAVCAFRFTDKYGGVGSGFMHVHHLTPISSLTEEVEIDPVHDLAPVCPNCHAMLHRRKPPYSIEEMRGIIETTAAEPS